MEEPLTLQSAIAERDAIIKQLNEVAPQLQIRLAYLHGWIDSKQTIDTVADSLPAAEKRIKKPSKK